MPSAQRRAVVEFNMDGGEVDRVGPVGGDGGSGIPVGGGAAGGGSAAGGATGGTTVTAAPAAPLGGNGPSGTGGGVAGSTGGGTGGGTSRGGVSDSLVVTLYNLDRLVGILEVNSDGAGQGLVRRGGPGCVIFCQRGYAEGENAVQNNLPSSVLPSSVLPSSVLPSYVLPS